MHARQEHIGRNDKSHLENERDDKDDQTLPGIVTVKVGRRLLTGLEDREAKRLGDEHGDDDVDAVGDREGENGKAGGFKGLLKGRETLVPLALGRGGHDDVCPCGADLGEGEAGEENADGDQGDERVEDLGKGAFGYREDSDAGDAAVVGAPAGDGAEEVAGGAEGGGDGFAGDKGRRALVGGAFIEGDGFVGWGAGVFDDGDRGNESLEGVCDLGGLLAGV